MLDFAFHQIRAHFTDDFDAYVDLRDAAQFHIDRIQWERHEALLKEVADLRARSGDAQRPVEEIAESVAHLALGSGYGIAAESVPVYHAKIKREALAALQAERSAQDARVKDLVDRGLASIKDWERSYAELEAELAHRDLAYEAAILHDPEAVHIGALAAMAALKQVSKLEAERDELAQALKPFKDFLDVFEAKPINGLDPEEIYSIHGGENVEGGASLKWVHLRAARAALAKHEGKKG